MSSMYALLSSVQKSRDTIPATSRPRGVYTPGMFQKIKNISDFAEVLNVPRKAIPLIVVKPDTKCCTKDCTFDAIYGNSNRCPAHQRSWYPIAGQRGSDMYGPEFMQFAQITKKCRVCDCSQASCASAGYFPDQHPIYISKFGQVVAFDIPGLFSEERKEKLENGSLHLYPWHFFPNHLKRDTNGKWSLDYEKHNWKNYYDKENKAYCFPPPKNTIKDFIAEVYPSTLIRPQERWMENGRPVLPEWLENIINKDRENVSEQNKDNTPSPSAQEARAPIMTRQRQRQADADAATSPQPSPSKITEPATPKFFRSDQNISYWKARAIHLETENSRLSQKNETKLSLKRKHAEITNELESKLHAEKDQKTKLQEMLELEKQKIITQHNQKISAMERMHEAITGRLQSELQVEKNRNAELQRRILDLEVQNNIESGE